MPPEDAAALAPAAPAPPATPWHQGIEAEYVGHWDNKGWAKDDPKTIAIEATRQARELEKHFGVPADQLLKMPKTGAPETEIKGFWQRLGVPSDAKDYDFSSVKFGGADLEPGFADTLRQTLHKNNVPKDKATPLVADIVKWLEGQEVVEQTEAQQRIEQNRSELTKTWGTNAQYNRLKAMDGARMLGLGPEEVDALEKAAGYTKTMEALRRVGMSMKEADFVDRGVGTNGTPATSAGAIARLNELMADPGWTARLMAGDATAKQEYMTLTTAKAIATLGYDPMAA